MTNTFVTENLDNNSFIEEEKEKKGLMVGNKHFHGIEEVGSPKFGEETKLDN